VKIGEKLITALLVLLLLAGAFLLRLNFLIHERQLPVVWDAAGYSLQAREFYEAWKSVSDPEAFRRHFFRGYEMALDKGEVYPLFLSVVYYFWGSNFPAARIAQAVLGTLSLLLLFAVTARLLGKRIALPALLVAAVYPPFILSEGRLLTETVAIFLLLLVSWLLTLSLARGSLAAIFFAGVATAFLTVSRTFFQFSSLVFFPLVLVGLKVGKKKRWFLRSLPFLAGFALIIVPRLSFTPQVDKHHRRLISGSWKNGLAMYCGVYPPNQGYQTDSDPGGEVFSRVRREARGRLSADDVYLKTVAELILSDPGSVAPVILGKAGIFWKRAYNDFLQSYLLSPEGMDILNRAVLFLGFWGLASLLGLGPAAWPFLAACLYTWALCFLADAEARYTLPAIPFMIAAGVHVVYRLGRGSIQLWKKEMPLRLPLLLCLILAGLLLALSRLSLPSRLLAFSPNLEFSAAYRLHVALVVLGLLSPGPIMFLAYRAALTGSRRWAAVLLPALVSVPLYLCAISLHPFGQEWSLRLFHSGQTATQTITLPAEALSWKGAELKLDLVSGPGRDYDLLVMVDGKLVRRFERGLSADSDSYIAQRRAFPIYLREQVDHRGQARHLSEVGQWFTVPLDPATLVGKKEITVDVKLEPLGASRDSWVDLYGDYPSADGPASAFIPTFSQSPSELSLYRYLVEDDWRLWRKATVLPGASSYAEGGKSFGTDLSPASGRQTGRYRIFLNHRRDPPPSVSYPVAVRSGDYLTKKTHVASYYHLALWEVNPARRKGNRMLLEIAHAASGAEGAFSMAVYADSDNDGKPDRLLASSPVFQGEKAGDWSSWEFETAEKSIFVGMTWPEKSQTMVYRENARWPDDLFPEWMFYGVGKGAPKANPVVTNMRLRFLEPGQSAAR
jgi:hypothetical protein